MLNEMLDARLAYFPIQMCGMGDTKSFIFLTAECRLRDNRKQGFFCRKIGAGTELEKTLNFLKR